MGRNLFDDEDNEEPTQLSINQDYADRYSRWREKEVVQKLKDKYGENVNLNELEDEESTSEEEDENAEALTEDIEKEFFRTLASLKKKDPKIYEEKTSFFDKTVEVPTSSKAKKKEKPVFLKDFERELLIKTEGNPDQIEDGADGSLKRRDKSYFEEQAELKKSFKDVLEDSDHEGDDGLLKVRKKTEKEKRAEEAEYRSWLLGQTADIKDPKFKKEVKVLHDVWTDPNLEKSEVFLRDFILNKRYLDPDDEGRVPTYNEIVHDSEGDLSEDERTLERQEEFEQKFNFRFEEPDQEFIKRYPRTIADTMRRKDESRKEKREDRSERKKEEKQKMKEELKLLKAAKRREISEKLEKLQQITGNEKVGFHDEDIEEDFDPEKHDERMRQIFADDFYEEGEEEVQKPVFDFDPELDNENWDSYEIERFESNGAAGKGESSQGAYCEDEDFNMDADYNPKASYQQEVIDMSRRKKGKRQSLFAKAVETEKPVFDPSSHPSYEEYLDEYYRLDYEDIVGDLPVRFKYRKVLSNDFGLSTEEILAAREKELNRWCSVKKTCQYRTEEEEQRELHAFKNKGGNLDHKKKVLPSIFEENTEEILKQEQDEKRERRTRKRKGSFSEATPAAPPVKTDNAEPPKKKKKKKKKTATDSSAVINVPNGDSSTAKMSAPGAAAQSDNTAPKAVSKKKGQEVVITATPSGSESSVGKPKKKKKKQAAVHAEQGASDEAPVSAVASNENQKKITETAKKPKNKEKNKLNENVNLKVSEKSKKIKKQKKEDFSLGMSDERLAAYGFNPKKFKNFRKFGKK